MDETRGADPHQLAVPAIASAAAAVMHAAAAGIHAEHSTLSRIFVAFAVLQGAAAVAGFLRPGRASATSLALINAASVAGWLTTRLTGIGRVGGLENAERPQLADSITAALAAVAVTAAVAVLARRAPSAPRGSVGMAALVAGVLVIPGLASATDHDHDAGSDAHAHASGQPATATGTSNGSAAAPAATQSDDHGDDAGDHSDHSATEPASAAAGHDHSADPTATDGSTVPAPSWPRPWDPTAPVDFSGVAGVSAEQQSRAEQLARDTMRDLPAFADVATVGALGYQSIGDASTGFEHYVNYGYIGDDKFLDPTAPESLVYRVDGSERALVSAMFIGKEMALDDPVLTDYGGRLMEWHVHLNLCWSTASDGRPVVVRALDSPNESCPTGSVNAGGENPMVHVWITPHECGPFAALEGHGAGQAADDDGARADQCTHDHDGFGDDSGDGGEPAAAAAKPYDPSLPIDLGGLDGVTPQQQAFAENLVAATLRDLPQFADPAVAEAAGYYSIGDGATGHEHYIRWQSIDDDVWLDPDDPESLVYEPQPDGSKKLVSAMFMLPGGYELDEVPDWGGALMQWHVHGDLCFTDDEAPRVVSVKHLGTDCPEPFVDFPLSPMIHVWITPHECGPFAALEGVAGGQVPEGETILCDTAHGSH